MKKLSASLFAMAGCLLIFGCATEYIEVDRTLPPYYEPTNFQMDAEGFSALPRRVLVLPSWGRAPTVTLRELDEILQQELGKVNSFEIVQLPSSKIVSRRSEQDFTLSEAEELAQQAGTDGVLTCRITQNQPYKPMTIGMVMRLWNIPKRKVVWAVDETLDSRLTLVANGARNYYLTSLRAVYPARRSEHILESPRLFYQYALAEMVSTLPLSEEHIRKNVDVSH
jgi:hypothetical protein